jgi:hypothetical protein
MVRIIMAFAALGVFEITPLIIRKKWKELIIVCSLFALALVMSFAYYANPKITGIIAPVTNFMRDVLGITYDNF